MRLIILTTILLLGLVAQPLQAQIAIDWNTLADVSFEKKYDEDLGYSYSVANFGPQVSKLQGQEVAITGYLIPMDATGLSFALSLYPNSSCFFCGGAGPETVIELRMPPGKGNRYATDERRRFRGTLQLNVDNRQDFNYVLLNAQEMQ